VIGPIRHDLTITLDPTLTVPARLTHPATGNGPWPTVVLFHGADPPDMDATIRGTNGTMSANFRLLAERLPDDGLAVLRFAKRGQGLVDQLIEDAGAVLAAARRRREVGPLVLYGWSQGARVAVHAADADPRVTGLILHAGRTEDWSGYFRHVLVDVVESALRREIDRDGDGWIDIEDLARVTETTSPVAFTLATLVWDPAAPPGSRLRHSLDPNGVGRFSIDRHWAPLVRRIVERPTLLGSPFLDPAHEPRDGIGDVLARLAAPTLVLQGERDGWVDPAEADRIAARAPLTTVVRRYPELGHALNPVPEPAKDESGPMSSQVLDDIAKWVSAHAYERRDARRGRRTAVGQRANPDRRVEIAPGVDPLSAMVTVAGDRGKEFVIYEDDDGWVAGIGAAAVLHTEPGGIVMQYGERKAREAVPERLLPRLGEFVAEHSAPDRPALGYLAFPPTPDAPPSVHLIVPRTFVVHDGWRLHVRSVDPAERDAVATALAAARPQPPAPPRRVAVDAGAQHYRRIVAEAVARIRGGELDKVILSRRVPVEFPVDVVATYRRGRAVHTPARSFLLHLGRRWAAGFSPEVLLEVRGGRVRTEPLAGTRALGTDHDADLRADLMRDPKEIYEHAISVKIAFDELSSCCVPGSVVVEDLMAVRERGSVQHIGSRVSGRLGPYASAWHALEAVYPGVTASGIPKDRALRCIAELEGTARDLYAGAVLHADASGALDACLTLRTLFSDGQRAWLQAGAGVVSESRPEREYRETCEKLESLAPHVVPRS
jgi:salicylate synthetase